MMAASLLCLFPDPGQASGYRITNQSLTSVGIVGAHPVLTSGPDASYCGQTDMLWLANTRQTETSLTFFDLPSVEYRDCSCSPLAGSSESELFFMPLVHAVSSRYGDLRCGCSLTLPAVCSLAAGLDGTFTQGEAHAVTVGPDRPLLTHITLPANFSHANPRQDTRVLKGCT